MHASCILFMLVPMLSVCYNVTTMSMIELCVCLCVLFGNSLALCNDAKAFFPLVLTTYRIVTSCYGLCTCRDWSCLTVSQSVSQCSLHTEDGSDL